MAKRSSNRPADASQRGPPRAPRANLELRRLRRDAEAHAGHGGLGLWGVPFGDAFRREAARRFKTRPGWTEDVEDRSMFGLPIHPWKVPRARDPGEVQAERRRAARRRVVGWCAVMVAAVALYLLYAWVRGGAFD